MRCKLAAVTSSSKTRIRFLAKAAYLLSVSTGDITEICVDNAYAWKSSMKTDSMRFDLDAHCVAAGIYG
eukprot:2900485-Pleurochrysis_carterae.AAC.1